MKAKITIVLSGKTKEAINTILSLKKDIETHEFQKEPNEGLKVKATFEYIER